MMLAWYFTVGSAIGFVVALSLGARTMDRRTRIALCGALAVYLALVVFLFSPWKTSVTPKGANDRSELAMILGLYVSMILGMLGESLFRFFELPQSNRKGFDWGTFIAPLFASPLIFLPLLQSLENAQLDLRILDRPRIMLFLVAFENGFLWKAYFNSKKSRKGS